MNHRVRMSKDDNVALLNELLAMDIEVTYDECEKLKGAHISFSWLKKFFKDHHTKSLRLHNAQGGRLRKMDK